LSEIVGVAGRTVYFFVRLFQTPKKEIDCYQNEGKTSTKLVGLKCNEVGALQPALEFVTLAIDLVLAQTVPRFKAAATTVTLER